MRHPYAQAPVRLMVLALTLGSLGVAQAQHDQPNVVFILADDLGWSDTTLHGTTSFYRTPNVERLAKRGMTFTRAYSASPLCSPTRASILTGLSPARHGITAPQCHLPKVNLTASVGQSGPVDCKATVANSVTRLKTDYYTLAETMKDHGYVTGHFGKWHLGPEPYSPLEHGFDVDLPHHPGPGPAGSYVAPWKFQNFDHDPDVPDQHIEDRMAAEAVAFMEAHRDQPFFLNYWMFSVHAPFDAKADLIDRYRKIVDPSNPQRCPTYAAMVESMDDAVGTLIDALDRLRLTDDTIIVFTSDNGGNMYNEVEGVPPTSNAPLRGGKATMFEGGTRVPCIVLWPGITKPGTRNDTLVQSEDFYPTLLDGLGWKPAPGQFFDGISLVPALRGNRLDRSGVFQFFPHQPRVPDWLPPSVSIVQDDWKLIRVFHGGQSGRHRYKLFHLADDIGERANLASRQPEKVQKLDALISEFLADTSAVVPLPNADFDPAKYRPELEGVPNRAQRKSGGKPVAGWSPSRDCTLSLDGTTLVMKSSGGDPYASMTFPEPAPAGADVVTVTIASDSTGDGQIFWKERGSGGAFSAERRLSFQVQHDGEPHEYRLRLPATARLTAIRIDPSRGPGTIRISRCQLMSVDGNRWKALIGPRNTPPAAP